MPFPLHPDALSGEQAEDAFDKRYLLVTPDNLKELMGKYEELFRN